MLGTLLAVSSVLEGGRRYKLQGVRVVRVVPRKFAVPHGGEGVAARVALPAPR